MSFLTFAFCTYNRADRLKRLVNEICKQESPIPYELLVINNNSTDNTEQELQNIFSRTTMPCRYVNEAAQGIVAARNRAIEEALASDYLIFIDDDELPCPGYVTAVVEAFERDGADCVGGPISVDFTGIQRPKWFDEELLGFLGEVNYGNEPFWITDLSTPVWSGNIAYKTSLFRNGLRFDHRYNRAGKGIGGGEDVIMFQTLLNQGVRIRYRPDMRVSHFVEEWRLNRRYFLKLHYLSGIKEGRFQTGDYRTTILGIPPFMFKQSFNHILKTLGSYYDRNQCTLRQAMNFTHSIGLIIGRYQNRHNRRQVV